jgi:hypothetical protein
MGTHDAVHNILLPSHEMLASTWNNNNYIHFLQSRSTFFRYRVDIMLTKDNIHTLTNIVITNPTWADFFPQSCTTQGFTSSNASQSQKMSYCDQHSINQFLPLTIEVFGCLHKQANVFLHDCANVIWSLKGLEGLHLFILVIFFHQKISITMQRMQAPSILSWAIAIGLAISWLPPLYNTPPITTTNLL